MGLQFGNPANHSTPQANCGALAKTGLLSLGYWTFTCPDLPPNAKVTNAFIKFTAQANNSGFPYIAGIGCLARDGKWNKPSHTGWVRLGWNDFRMEVYDTGSTKKVETVTAGVLEGIWSLRPAGEAREELAQTWRNNSGSSFTLGSMKLHLRKVGSPTENVSLKVYRATWNGDFNPAWPDPLAASDSVDVSTVPGGTGGDVTFDFSGDDQITIYTPYAQYITVLVGDYAKSSSNYIGWNFDANAGYGGGYPARALQRSPERTHLCS
jgi:hypothetical protein